MQIRVTGGTDLARTREALRRVGDKALSRKMSKALQSAARPLGPEVRREIPRALPLGYAPELSRSMRFRTSVRERSGYARVQIRVYGDGRRQRRDVPTINRGTLRHPLFGNRNRWYAQRVRPGFVDRPVDRLIPGVVDQMQTVVDAVAEQITQSR